MALLSFPEAATAFGAEDGHLWLRRLCGMACGNAGTDDLPRRARGLGVLCLGRDRFEGDDWRAIAVERGPEGLRVTWDVGAGRARVESEWLLCPETGVGGRPPPRGHPPRAGRGGSGWGASARSPGGSAARPG